MKTGNQVSLIPFIFAGLLAFAGNNSLFPRGEINTLNLVIEAAPKLDNIETKSLLYAPGGGKVKITASLTVTDDDSRQLKSAIVKFTAGYTATEDILSFNKQNRIEGKWDNITGVLTLTGSSSVANFETALRSIQYENTNLKNPSETTRTVSFTVNDGQASSNTVTRNIEIKSSNIAPVLSGIETAVLVYCINSGPVVITSAITAKDADNTSLSSATVQITTGYTRDEDFLRYTNQNGINGSWDGATGKLSLSGTALVENYNTALRSIQYENTNTFNPAAGNHIVSFTVNDGINASNTLSRNIAVNKHVGALLSGSVSYCEEDNISIPLSVAFSGTSPWTFILMRDNGNEVTYKDINTNPFTFNVKEEGTYRIKSIADASCKGDTSGSGYAKIIFKPSPTAIISGIDSICQGETAALQVTLTGTSPWTIAYRRNSGSSVTINGITSNNYTLKVTQTGTFTLTRVEDAICKGKVSGEGIVRSYSIPTANISGSASICEHTSADLTVTLTGNAPWKFSYKRNSENPIEIPNVITSPRTVPVHQDGTFTLYEVFDKNCKGTVSGGATITVNPAPDVTISGLAPAYDKQSVEWVPITGTPPGGTFSGPGVIPYNENWYFVPSLPPVGTYNIIYSYQESPGSCYGNDTAVVRILAANAVIEFENSRKKYCLNDRSFTITGINMSNVLGSFTISGDVGLVDHHNNSATINPSQLTVGEYTITYTYFDGTTLSVNDKFDIGDPPLADFSWGTECFHTGQATTLSDKSISTFGNITGYTWKFYTATGYETYTTHDVTHIFPQAGNHSIDLVIQTSYGCADTASKVFGLKPIFKLADNDYYEDFADNPIDWQSGTSPTVTINSWRLGSPSNGFSGDYCWYTYIPGTSAPREQSWITSPCFDFTGTDRPTLKMNIWRLFNLDRDGATMQYTTDGGKAWNVLGELNDGIHWYNDYQIDGKPGNQSLGWSNYNGTGNDVSWAEAKHSLDLLRNKPEVQFRIAYGSDGTARENNGFAMDDFWIGERNRTVLLEHFTNSSDERSKTANTQLNSLVNSNLMNIIDLQYHTAFPGADPFNQQNPSVPSARVFYYGLSDVPYTILNGGSKSSQWFDYDGRPLESNTVIVESLHDSKFWIILNSKVDGTILNTNAQVYALEDIPATQLTLHIAITEQVVTKETGSNGETSFESVVKTLLPDAAGTSIYQEWKKDEPRDIDVYWEMQNVYDDKQLRVVAFVQDESTSEVYQAVLDTIGTYIPTIDDYLTRSPAEKSFIIYPNPAERKACIEFSQKTTEDITLELYNNLGSLVCIKYIPSGINKTEMPVDIYPDGLYLLRLVSRNQLIGISKLTISK
jgi:hypothetical protein